MNVTDILLFSIFGFVTGAYLPATVFLLLRYVRNEWTSGIRSSWFFVRLIWGSVWRIVGSFAMLIAVLVVIGIITDFKKGNEAVIGLSMLAGFFGSIALFIFLEECNDGARAPHEANERDAICGGLPCRPDRASRISSRTSPPPRVCLRYPFRAIESGNAAHWTSGDVRLREWQSLTTDHP